MDDLTLWGIVFPLVLIVLGIIIGFLGSIVFLSVAWRMTEGTKE